MQEKTTVEKGLDYTGIIMLFGIGISSMYKADIMQLAIMPLILIYMTFAALKLRDDKRAGNSTQKAYLILIVSTIAIIMMGFVLIDTYLMNRGM